MFDVHRMNEIWAPASDLRGRPWAESAVWGALWLLSTGNTPGWLADHQPSRIRRRLRSLRPSGLLWAVRNRAEVHRFRASATVLRALRPHSLLTGVAAVDADTDLLRLEGYVTPDRFEWIRSDFPVVPDRSGNVVLRVGSLASHIEGDTMPIAFAIADMAESDDRSEAERGLLMVDDLLREYNDDSRSWLTVPDIARAIADELEQGDEVFALRVLANVLSAARSLTEPADVVRFLQEPSYTGDRRWDVLLAAAVARECRLRGIMAPGWTEVPGLEPWWFPALVDETLIPLTVQRTPPELASRGIWLDERALEAV
ncbi:MAG: hypothetical protein ACFCU2_13630 [Acidimicrobiia bacterium]